MEPLIEGQFCKYNEKLFDYSVQLSLQGLRYHNNATKERNIIREDISINDITGCACLKSKSNRSQNAFLVIYIYALMGKQKQRRKRKTVTFEISQGSSFEENLEIANKWRSLIYYALYFVPDVGIQRRPLSKCILNTSSDVNDANEPVVPLYSSTKKLLVLINPKSGPGLAYEIYKRKVKPVLNEAEVAREVILTSYSMHAYKLIQHKDLSLYSGIVIVSGDGLLYEVYNGLFQRSDRKTALSVPVGIIPGGSGNGLARSVAYLLNEPYRENPVLISTLNVVNSVATPMDLILVQNDKGNKLISILSVGYGIMSDIDIESEIFRSIGEARFTVYAFARILKLRKYRARLSYKVAEHVELHDKHKFLHRAEPHIVKSQTVEEAIDFEKKAKSIADNRRPASVAYLDNEDDISVVDLTEENNFINTSVKMDNGNEAIKVNAQNGILTSNYLGDIVESEDNVLMKPVPDDWTTIEDDFVSIYAVTQPYVGTEVFMSPRSTLNDGVMWLSYLNGNVSKALVMKYLLSLSSGRHVNLPGVHYIPVTGFRLEPLSSSGNITVDGELIELGTVQTTVLPGMGRIMTRHK